MDQKFSVESPGYREEVGTRIKNIRCANNMTQEDLAYILGVDTKTISRYETGKTFPSSTSLIKISLTCKVSIDYICYGYNFTAVCDDSKRSLIENLLQETLNPI